VGPLPKPILVMYAPREDS